MKPLISAIMIVKNEEANLPRCLESVQGVCDEICIVDTGSTDATVSIAEKFGARVERFVWTGNESDARNVSARMATGKWLFVIDADEEISPELADELKQKLPALDANPAVHSLSVVWRNHYQDGSKSLTRIIRIGRNAPEFQFQGNIHPTADYQPQTAELESCLDHYGYIWTPEQRARKSRHMLEHLEPLIQGEKPELGRLGQYVTYLLVDNREDEVREILGKIKTVYSPQERAGEPYWRQTLGNLLPYFAERDDLESGKFWAEEIFQTHPNFVSAGYYLLQRAVRDCDWQKVDELAPRVLRALDEPVGIANLVFLEIQRPAVDVWYWLAKTMRDEAPTLPERLFQSRFLPVVMKALRECKLAASQIPSPLNQLLKIWISLQENHGNGSLPPNTVASVESIHQSTQPKTAWHLLSALILIEVLRRSGKMTESLGKVRETLEDYADHRWFVLAQRDPATPRPYPYETLLHQT